MHKPSNISDVTNTHDIDIFRSVYGKICLNK